MAKTNGETLDLNIDDLFDDNGDDPEAGTPPAKEQPLELTAAMTKRINEVRAKTEATVRDNIAKDLGFDTYEEMEKAKDKKAILEAGYDPDDLEAIIEPLVEKRLASDPRMLKLQEIEAQEKETYIDTQLSEVERLTGLKVTKDDLPKETLDLWSKGVDLAQAYIATNAAKIVSSNTKGSTAHLQSGSGTSKIKRRGLSEQEKELYRAINADITEEELNKKTVEVN
jgi:hypothetical protein